MQLETTRLLSDDARHDPGAWKAIVRLPPSLFVGATGEQLVQQSVTHELSALLPVLRYVRPLANSRLYFALAGPILAASLVSESFPQGLSDFHRALFLPWLAVIALAVRSCSLLVLVSLHWFLPLRNRNSRPSCLTRCAAAPNSFCRLC